MRAADGNIHKQGKSMGLSQAARSALRTTVTTAICLLVCNSAADSKQGLVKNRGVEVWIN
ncbi:hypothetical protein HNQ53_003057 [Microbulbifer hydrolyticus]|uniref:Uncharacterized protein n=1 Tax=Microbulbifer hydrolyticus TaxID=48074 RepID=A0AA89TMX9_9GAMM|nr:hypothetical protein [Microbulbifer hydrolyticus]